MYGERNTFGDVRDTISKMLDDFYAEADGNFNQAFLDLERKLQAYVGYRPHADGAGDKHRQEEEDEIPDYGRERHQVDGRPRAV